MRKTIFILWLLTLQACSNSSESADTKQRLHRVECRNSYELTFVSDSVESISVEGNRSVIRMKPGGSYAVVFDKCFLIYNGGREDAN